MTTQTPNRHPTSEIVRLHKEIISAAQGSLANAVTIGRLLVGIKDQLDHGEWMPWLKKNITQFSEETARRYMRCYEHRKVLLEANVEDATVAYKLLSSPPKTVTVTVLPSETPVNVPQNAVSAPAKAPAPPADVPRDCEGYPIPKKLVPFFARTPEVEELQRHISIVIRALNKAYEEKDRLYGEVNTKGIATDLDNLNHKIKCAIPYAVCYQCQGHPDVSPCGACKGRGFVSKFLIRSFPIELRNVRAKGIKK